MKGFGLACVPKANCWSRPPNEQSARRAQQLAHQIQVHSSKGGTTFEMSRGPEGLSVSCDGKVQWKVPKNADRKEHEAIITIGDSFGKQVFHTVPIKAE